MTTLLGTAALALGTSAVLVPAAHADWSWPGSESPVQTTNLRRCNAQPINGGLETICITGIRTAFRVGWQESGSLSDLKAVYTYRAAADGKGLRRGEVKVGLEATTRDGAGDGDRRWPEWRLDVTGPAEIDYDAPLGWLDDTDDYIQKFPCVRAIVSLDGQVRASNSICP